MDDLEFDVDGGSSLTEYLIRKGIELAIDGGWALCKRFFEQNTDDSDEEYASIKAVRKALKKMRKDTDYSYGMRQKFKELRRKLKGFKEEGYDYISYDYLKQLLKKADII